MLFCPLFFQENISSSTGIAQRARHPDELKKESGWMIDIDYYLSQQVCYHFSKNQKKFSI